MKYKGESKMLMMKLHRGYLYYVDYGAISASLYRIKTNGKSRKYLGTIWDYAVSKDRIYYKGVKVIKNGEDYKAVNRQMKLDGKKKSDGPYKVRTRRKNTNIKGYRLDYEKIESEDEYYQIEYLVLPNKERIKLCSYSW